MILLAIFLTIQIAGVVVLVTWWRETSLPIPSRPHPSLIFRLVKRDERAVYVRIMRRTYAVALRDAGRAFDKMTRQISLRLTPIMERMAEALSKVLDR